MPELQPLRADHASAVLAFEQDNRAWFARSISDRGEEYFERFFDDYQSLLDEQEAGVNAFYLFVDDDGAILGRFNLYDLTGGSAELGYRVAEAAAGRGVATAAVRELCALVPARHGLRTLKAGTSDGNVASQKVLAKTGFVRTGPGTFGGKPGAWYQRDLDSGAVGRVPPEDAADRVEGD